MCSSPVSGCLAVNRARLAFVIGGLLLVSTSAYPATLYQTLLAYFNSRPTASSTVTGDTIMLLRGGATYQLPTSALASVGSGLNQLTGDGTAGPGTLSQVFTLAASGVSANTYGDATHVPQCTFDAKGRATTCVNVLISGGGGGSGTVTNAANLLDSKIVLGDGGTVGVKTATTGTGVVTALGVNTGSAGAFVVNGGALGTPSSGTLTSATGLPITGGTTGTLGVTRGGTGLTTVAADQVFVGTAADTLTAKSIADCDDSAGNHLNYDTTTHAFSCGNSASGGGGATGFGVDGGGSAQAVTGTATISNGTRLVKVASGWATGTLTLPAISAVSSDTCIRVEDGGNFVDATHTLTLKGGVSDGLNGGAANGTVGAFTTSGAFLIACVSAANNWNVGPGSIATSSAPSNQFANGVTINGLSYAQPAFTNISGTAAAAQLPAASTSTQGAAKLHNVPVSLGWVATVNPTSAVIAVINQASTISAIIGAVETATGSAATVTVFKAPSGTACGSGTALHSGTFNANGTAATNQTLTVTTSSVSAGDRLCVTTTGTTAWTGGTGIGTITVFLAPS